MRFLIATLLLFGFGNTAFAQSGHAGHNHAQDGSGSGARHSHDGHDHGKADREPEFSEHDQLRIAVQEICPVLGEPLGSMGTPVKVTVGQETVFLCCKGCLQKKINPKHWATIHANIAKAQRICPVMKKELPPGAEMTIVEGQVVYVCCPGCTEKIEANPKAFLQKVDQQYATSLQEKREQLRIAVQKICPVSGGKLGSMGKPIKVKIGQETVYLCCKGCLQKKIKPEHWQTIHQNILQAQKTCPVMDRPLPPDAKWSIVDGQIVYVCCKPCTEKLAKNPKKYLRYVDNFYAAALRKTQVRK